MGRSPGHNFEKEQMDNYVQRLEREVFDLRNRIKELEKGITTYTKT